MELYLNVIICCDKLILFLKIQIMFTIITNSFIYIINTPHTHTHTHTHKDRVGVSESSMCFNNAGKDIERCN